MSVLNNVEILDLINIHVYNPNVFVPGEIRVDFQPIEKGKRVVIDSDAVKTLEEILKERANDKFDDARDPKVKKDIEEFVGRMCIEWHKSGLLLIEDVPDAPSDPYEQAKKMLSHGR